MDRYTFPNNIRDPNRFQHSLSLKKDEKLLPVIEAGQGYDGDQRRKRIGFAECKAGGKDHTLGGRIDYYLTRLYV